MVTTMPCRDRLMVIEAPVSMNNFDLAYYHDSFVRQREDGLIVLPKDFKIVYVEPCCEDEKTNIPIKIKWGKHESSDES